MTKQEIANELPPKRIYHWLNSQLSIARFSGGCILNGVQYIIRYDLEGQPLEEVRPKPKKKSTTKKEKQCDFQSQCGTTGNELWTHTADSATIQHKTPTLEL